MGTKDLGVVCLLLGVLLLSMGPVEAQTLTIGQTVPDFQLVDQDGEKTSLSDFQGKGVIISFLYTKCPFPDKCPMIRKKLAGLADLMDKLGRKEQIQVLAITLDPANDRPEVLKKYAQGYDRQEKGWKFLTGDEEQILKITKAFGVLYWDEDDGTIEHNMRTAYIDEKGKLRLVKSRADWKPGEFAAEIDSLFE